MQLFCHVSAGIKPRSAVPSQGPETQTEGNLEVAIPTFIGSSRPPMSQKRTEPETALQRRVSGSIFVPDCFVMS
jgi:hypothetical protein